MDSALFSRPRLNKKGGHKVLHGLQYHGKLVEKEAVEICRRAESSAVTLLNVRGKEVTKI